MNTVHCHQCSKTTQLEHKVSFREECPHCGSDLHICLNCRFYDKAAYNECKEPSAERVGDKERNNYCEYFDPTEKGKKSGSLDRAEQLKKAEALFKKNF
ncbi:MAG: hypothetical protein F4X95_01840 [Oligoflexia bacterium]|nr:hypothetical protein [Oligoflexia bacterium]